MTSMTRSIIAKRKYVLWFMVLIMMVQFFPVLRLSEARLTATLYSLKYYDKHLQYEEVEFDPHFGAYIVTFRDKNGKLGSFVITGKYFPFFVTYDSIVGNG